MSCTHLLARFQPVGCAICKAQASPVVLPSAPPEPEVIWDEPADDDEPIDPDASDAEHATEVLRLLDQEACKASLAEFVRLAFAVVRPGVELEWGPHIQAICDHIQWMYEERDRVVRARRHLLTKHEKLRAQNLLVNVPPRSLKTIVLTLSTVWAWLRWPTLKILYLSRNPRVSTGSARMARDLMYSAWFRTTFRPSWNPLDLNEDGDPIPEPEPLWNVRPDQDALSDLGNTAGGTRCARGLASMITGEGCEILLIDDPHDVRDGTERVGKAVEDYDGAVHNRLNNHTTDIRICIMQRVRQNDLSAAWIASNDRLVHLRLPTQYEFDYKVECKCGSCTAPNVTGFMDWRTEDGEVLHPLFTSEFIAAEQKRLQSRYVGQHQQRPTESGGVVFRVSWWSWWSMSSTTPCARPMGARQEPAYVLPRRRNGSLDVDHLCISVDATGGSTSTTASALGIGIFVGKGERRFLLRDLTPGPRTWLQTLGDLRQAILTAVQIAGHQPKICVLVEKKAMGQAAIEQLTEYIREGDLKYPDGRAIVATVAAYEPSGKGSKEERAELMEPDLAAGLLALEDGCEVNTVPYRNEVESFPKAERDDRVDYTSQYMDYYRGKKNSWVELFKSRRAEQQARLAGQAQAQKTA